MDEWRRGHQELELNCCASQFPVIYTVGTTLHRSFTPQPSTLLETQHTIREAQQHMQKVELTTVLTNGSNDRYMVERESVRKSRHGKFGIWGKFRSLCLREEKWGKGGKKAQISAKVAGLKWHSCPWSTVMVKAKKKDGYSSECSEKAANSELRNNSKPFLFHLFGTIRQMWNPKRWRQHQSLAEAFTGIDLLKVTPSHTDWVGEAKIQGGFSAASLASSSLITNGEGRGFSGAPGQGEF